MIKTLRTYGIAALLGATLSTAAVAAPESYVLDASHSQILFSYNHLGFSTTWNIFSGFDGTITFDEDAPARSSVAISFPLSTLFTGWEARFKHFMSPDFFNAKGDEVITFNSTSIEVTGDNTAKITGDQRRNQICDVGRGDEPTW